MGRKIQLSKTKPVGNIDAFEGVQEERKESEDSLFSKEVRYRCEMLPDHVRTEPFGSDKPETLRCPQCQYQSVMNRIDP